MPQLENICKFVKGFSFKNTNNTENSAIRKQTTHQKKKMGKRSEQTPHQGRRQISICKDAHLHLS